MSRGKLIFYSEPEFRRTCKAALVTLGLIAVILAAMVYGGAELVSLRGVLLSGVLLGFFIWACNPLYLIDILCRQTTRRAEVQIVERVAPPLQRELDAQVFHTYRALCGKKRLVLKLTLGHQDGPERFPGLEEGLTPGGCYTVEYLKFTHWLVLAREENPALQWRYQRPARQT